MEKRILTKDRVIEFMAKYSIYFIMLLMIIICSFLNPKFLTQTNMTNILRQICVYALLAFGESILLISGNIDLAAGSTVAFVSCAAVYVYLWSGSLLLSIIAAILLGALVNFVSGLFTVYFRIPGFIATLGMQSAVRGLALLITKGTNITDIDKGFKVLGQGEIFGLPISILVMFFCAFLLWALLERTRLGRNFYAIGGNKEAARASGININRSVLLSFVLSGCFIGLAAVVYASRINAGMPASAVGYESTGLTSAIIGGVGFAGGTGSAWGIIIGALVLGIINNILNLLGIPSYIQNVVYGLLIVAAVGLDTLTRTRRVSR